MDINKTIIQVDAAGGRTLEDVLNSNVAANVFGTVDPTSGKWKALYGPFDSDTSSSNGITCEAISYDTFIDHLHCEPPGMQALPKKERDAVWKQVSHLRREAVKRFTFQGEAGERYASLVELQRRHLQHGDDYYHIIPSFFKLMNTLSDLDFKFTLIFRTFGSDLDAVLREWKAFVLGEHVCKPSGPVLRQMRDNYKEPLCGSVFRHKDDMFICYGPRVSLASFLGSGYEESDGDKVLARLQQAPACTSAYHTSFADLKDHLIDYFARSNNVGGLVDYYPNWAQGAERRTGGKVFPLQQGDSKHYYVFFDDNIFIGEERSIVDVREAESAESIVDPAVERKYCVPANAFKAIVNEDYFIDELCACLQLQCGTESNM